MRITRGHTISFIVGVLTTLLLLFLLRWDIMCFLIWVYLRH